MQVSFRSLGDGDIDFGDFPASPSGGYDSWAVLNGECAIKNWRRRGARALSLMCALIEGEARLTRLT